MLYVHVFCLLKTTNIALGCNNSNNCYSHNHYDYCAFLLHDFSNKVIFFYSFYGYKGKCMFP